MKKILALSLSIIVLALSIVSCGNNDDPIPTSILPTTSSTTENTDVYPNLTASFDDPGKIDGQFEYGFYAHLLSANDTIYGKPYANGSVICGVAVENWQSDGDIIAIPNTFKNNEKEYPVISIGYMDGTMLLTSAQRSALKELHIPSNVKVICSRSFLFCSNLTKVVFAEGLQQIDGMAFWKCSSLKEMALPSTLKTIGENAFASCTSLETLTIPASVTEIGDNAFAGCVNLKTVTIPSAFKDDTQRIFANCTGISFNFN